MQARGNDPGGNLLDSRDESEQQAQVEPVTRQSVSSRISLTRATIAVPAPMRLGKSRIPLRTAP